jgi:hypothetical protein
MKSGLSPKPVKSLNNLASALANPKMWQPDGFGTHVALVG